MRRVYNILLIILVIAAIAVGGNIIYTYISDKNTENDMTQAAIQLEEEIKNINTKDNSQKKEMTYKGYDVVGIIEIPKIDINYVILPKTTVEAMKISVTKFWGPEINEIGNFSIAGHNNWNGTMFGKVKRLEIGDIIKLRDLYNNTVEYKVFDKYSVDPNDISCAESVEPGTREVTLITCTKGHAQRLIVKAREVK